MKGNFFLSILLALSEASHNKIFPKNLDKIENSALESKLNELKEREIEVQQRVEANREELMKNWVECKYNQERYRRSVSNEEYLKFQKEFEGGVIGYNIQCQNPTPKFLALQEANKIETDVEERMQEIFVQNEKIKKRYQECTFLYDEAKKLKNTEVVYSRQFNSN